MHADVRHNVGGWELPGCGLGDWELCIRRLGTVWLWIGRLGTVWLCNELGRLGTVWLCNESSGGWGLSGCAMGALVHVNATWELSW